MRKYFVIAVTVLLAACGGSSVQTGNDGGPVGPGVGTILGAPVVGAPALGRGILNTTQDVMVAVTTYNGGSDTYENVACAAPADCQPFSSDASLACTTGGTWASGVVGKPGTCTTHGFVDSTFYVKDAPGITSTTGFPFPCLAGQSFSMLVFTMDAGTFHSYRRDFTVSATGCTASGTSADWVETTALPTLTSGTIYGCAGIAPSFTADLAAVKAPFVTTGWKFVHADYAGGTTPTACATSQLKATCDSPTTTLPSTMTSLDLTATVQLDSRFLLGATQTALAADAAAWALPVRLAAPVTACGILQ
jgi:hypothetical protein